jgi:hypothetical protein
MPTKKQRDIQQPQPSADVAHTRRQRELVNSSTNTPAQSDAKSPPVADPYESPLKKLKKTMKQYPTQLFTTIDSTRMLWFRHEPASLVRHAASTGVRNFIRSNNVNNADVRASVRIRARLLWTITDNVPVVDKSGHTTLLHFLRLYLSEEHAPEPLEDQIRVRIGSRIDHVWLHTLTHHLQDYQEYQRNDAMQTNQYLITTSLYEIDINDSRLPPQGAVIMFTPTKRRVYNNCVQIDTKIQNISVVAMPTLPWTRAPPHGAAAGNHHAFPFISCHVSQSLSNACSSICQSTRTTGKPTSSRARRPPRSQSHRDHYQTLYMKTRDRIEIKIAHSPLPKTKKFALSSNCEPRTTVR